MKQVTVSMSNSLNHSLKRFFKTADSFTNEASDCFWIINWIIHSNDSSKQLIHLQMKRVTVFLKKSLNHSLKWFVQNSWFIYKWSKWLYLNKSLNHSLKRFLQNSWFIYKWSKWLFLKKSLNHSLKRFFKTADSFTNEASDCVFE